VDLKDDNLESPQIVSQGAWISPSSNHLPRTDEGMGVAALPRNQEDGMERV
jgi:hypothetical protein